MSLETVKDCPVTRLHRESYSMYSSKCTAPALSQMEFTKKAKTSMESDLDRFQENSFANRFVGWYNDVRQNTSIRTSFIKTFKNELNGNYTTRCRFRNKYETEEIKDDIIILSKIINRTLMESSATEHAHLKFFNNNDNSFVEPYYSGKLSKIQKILEELLTDMEWCD